jgi:hypothetical protein
MRRRSETEGRKQRKETEGRKRGRKKDGRRERAMDLPDRYVAQLLHQKHLVPLINMRVGGGGGGGSEGGGTKYVQYVYIMREGS